MSDGTTETQTVADDRIRNDVRDNYAAVVERESGCCAPAEESGCCDAGDPVDRRDPGKAAMRMGYSEDEVSDVPEGANMGLGCGNPQAIAELQKGEVVVDLGSGGGFDCFLAARHVGATGHVIGVDMTPQMISKARANLAKSGSENIEFRLGEIEHLPVADETVDAIMSNCVINLSPDKPQVFAEAYRILKPGGRLAISDIVAVRPLPESVQDDISAYCGCIAGAALKEEVEKMLAGAGFEEVRVEIEPDSRAFIKNWISGSGIEDHIVSAKITARKGRE